MIFRGSIFIVLFTAILSASVYNFSVKSDKKVVHIGEEFHVSFVFNFKDGKKLAEVNFSPPVFENLHIIKKDLNTTNTSQKWIYTLSTNSDKNITIGSAFLDVALKKNINKPIGKYEEYDYDYLSFETKPLKIVVKNSKKSSGLYGDFHIKAEVDKLSLNENESLNLKLVVNGEGDIYDIGEFNLKIPNATVYSDKPLIKKNTFIQKFAIISSNDFTIPSFKIEYIDKNSKNLIVKKTNPIKIKVIKDKKSNPKYKNFQKIDITYVVVAFFLGFLSAYFLRYRKKKKDFDTLDFKQKIKEAKDTREILKLLLLKNDKRFNSVIEKLEDDIYLSKKNKLSKKEIVKIIFTTD